MAPLRLQQTAIPSLAGVSQILANAGKSFDQGLETARGTLGAFQQGQQEKADNSILNEIAKLGSEEELDAFLNSDALQGVNLSPEMQKTVLGLRKGAIANAGGRATNAQTVASTAINAAAEGRKASDFDRLAAERNERNALTGRVVDATLEGEQFGDRGTTDPALIASAKQSGPIAGGSAPASLVVTESGNNFQAQNNEVGSGGRKGHFGRVQFGQDRLDDAKAAGVIPQGMTPEQFLNDEQAQLRTEEWHFNDIQQGITRNGLDKFIGQTINGVPVTRDGMVAVAHLGGQAGLKQFLESNGSHNPSDANGNSLTDYLGIHAGSTSGNAAQQVTPVPAASTPSGTPARDRLADALRTSTTLSPADASVLLQGSRDAQVRGEARLDAERQEATDEISASSILKQTGVPDNQTTEAVVQDVITDLEGQNLTAGEILTGARRAAVIASGDLASRVAPSITGNPMVDSIIANELAVNNNTLDALPQTRLFKLAKQFKDDPTAGLIAHLNIGQDNQTPEDFDDNELRKAIELVRKRVVENGGVEDGVTPEVAAAALAQIFRRDPSFSSGGFLLGFNTVENRFNIDNAVKFVEDNLNKDALARYTGQVFKNQNTEQEFVGSQVELDTLRIRANKMKAGPEKNAVNARIANLEEILLTGNTPQEGSRALEKYIGPRGNGMADRLLQLDPDSPEFFRAQVQLEETIKADENLSSAERILLLSTIKG